MNRIQKRLTLSYSGWFLITLLIVLALVYGLMKMSIYDEVQKEMHAYLNHEAKAIQTGNRQEDTGNIDDRLERPLGFFDVFVPSHQGSAPHESDDTPLYKSAILKGHPDSNNHVVLTEITLKNGEVLHIALISKDIVRNHHKIGTLYVGKNLSAEHQRIEKWLFLLIFTAIVLFAISVLVGHFLAKRAMIPILNNIDRQRKFVADASHELKTPMSILQSSLEVIQRDKENRLSDSSGGIFDDMKEEIQHMNRLAGHLLTLASHNTGHLPVSDEIFSLNEVVSSVVRRFELLAAETGRRIRLDLDGSQSFMVMADRTRMEQILYILLENAVKFTSENGKIHIRLERTPERTVRIAVADNGIGIASAEQERIFDPFYRSENPESRSYGGSGLGLSIVRTIVERYHGSVQLKSEIGKGSTFLVNLPILIE
ncbi:MAG TPA: HAMP domain-containing sensor histidine kinase [Bacillales bacterium]|nr:HAMP domain-containing sensor histidine kinase [Bacillales bacterium]